MFFKIINFTNKIEDNLRCQQFTHLVQDVCLIDSPLKYFMNGRSVSVSTTTSSLPSFTYDTPGGAVGGAVGPGGAMVENAAYALGTPRHSIPSDILAHISVDLAYYVTECLVDPGRLKLGKSVGKGWYPYIGWPRNQKEKHKNSYTRTRARQKKSFIFENNSLTIGEQKNVAQNFHNLLLTEFHLIYTSIFQNNQISLMVNKITTNYRRFSHRTH